MGIESWRGFDGCFQTGFPFAKPSSINSNTLFQTIVVAVLIAHVGVLGGMWYSPRGINGMLALNVLLASVILVYTATRMRYIIAAMDWPYFGLIAFELCMLTASMLAFRESRPAIICSYVAFGLHLCVSVAAVVFAFTFKMNRMI